MCGVNSQILQGHSKSSYETAVNKYKFLKLLVRNIPHAAFKLFYVKFRSSKLDHDKIEIILSKASSKPAKTNYKQQNVKINKLHE